MPKHSKGFDGPVGVRFVRNGSRLGLTFARTPEKGDRVVSRAGIAVYLAPGVADAFEQGDHRRHDRGPTNDAGPAATGDGSMSRVGAPTIPVPVSVDASSTWTEASRRLRAMSALCVALVAPPMTSVPPVGYGGTERVVASLASGLVSHGHDVTVFASGDSQTAGTLVPIVPTALWDSGYTGDVSAYMQLAAAAVWSQSGRFDITIRTSRTTAPSWLATVRPRWSARAGRMPRPGPHSAAMAQRAKRRHPTCVDGSPTSIRQTPSSRAYSAS